MNAAIKRYIEHGKKAFTMTMTAGDANLTTPITVEDFTTTGALPVRIACRFLGGVSALRALAK